ncbi:MAG: sugar phosphate nucleotidyltransferase [Chloroflexi bacterium]|nr:sugar phosphate nucleotidyltransferase [Chloroflexota bacterium]
MSTSQNSIAPLSQALILMDAHLERTLRLAPSGDHPAFALSNGQPVVARLVQHLVRQGIGDICIVTHHLPGLVAHYFGDGAAFGARVTYLYEERPLGTGGGIAHAAGFWGGKHTLVVPGTLVTDAPIQEMAAAHRASGAEVTVAVVDADPATRRRRPRCTIDADGWVATYFPNPERVDRDDDTNGLVDAGAYLISPLVPSTLLADTVLDWSRDAVPDLVDKRLVFGWLTTTLVSLGSTPPALPSPTLRNAAL